jgi:hypothetical protein
MPVQAMGQFPHYSQSGQRRNIVAKIAVVSNGNLFLSHRYKGVSGPFMFEPFAIDEQSKNTILAALVKP